MVELIPWAWLVAGSVLWLAVCTACGIVAGELLARLVGGDADDA